jgi:hypothetical protein
MDDLLKEAIADAKAVRETALENAKIALEEAFTPRLQSMLSKKIQSEMDVEEQEDEIEDEEAPEEEAPEEGHYAEDDEDPGDEWSEEEPEMEQEEEPEMDMGDEEEEEMPEGVIEINGVKYAPVVSEEDEEEMGDEEAPEEDELDLEAILRELEDEDEEEEIDENDVSSDIGKSDNHVKGDAEDSSKIGAQGPEGEGSDSPAGKENSDDEVVDDLVDHKEGEGEVVSEQTEDEEVNEEEEIDLEEVIKALSEEEDEVEEANKAEKLQSELDEHRNVVKYLRSKLNEVNLLNAKLLFTNKLFRSFGLSNEQKMKVVENFDRAHNLREVKLVYSTLAESFGSKQTKTEIKESKGSASKPVASTKSEKQEVIAEGHEMRERFKKLAGIL